MNKRKLSKVNYIATLIFTVALISGFTALEGECANQSEIEKEFAKGKIEYHFILNDTTDVSEKNCKKLPAEIITQLSPMFIIKAKAKKRKAVYVDTKNRIYNKNTMILRVRMSNKKGKITIKSRSPSIDAVKMLKRCDKGKYEIDYSSRLVYSVSTDIKFKKDEFSIKNITPKKLFAFIKEKCSYAAEYLNPLEDESILPMVIIPGVTNQYNYKAELIKNHPLAKMVDEVELAIGFFPPTDKKIIELSFKGKVKNKDELDKLRKETLDFLKGKGLFSPVQKSKTNLYFETYLRK